MIAIAAGEVKICYSNKIAGELVGGVFALHKQQGCNVSRELYVGNLHFVLSYGSKWGRCNEVRRTAATSDVMSDLLTALQHGVLPFAIIWIWSLYLAAIRLSLSHAIWHSPSQRRRRL